MTSRTLERIKKTNRNIYFDIIQLKSAYKNDTLDKKGVRAGMRGYLTALQKIGFIGEQERKELFCYITL